MDKLTNKLIEHVKSLIGDEITQEVTTVNRLREDLNYDSLKFIVLLTNVCEENKINMMALDFNRAQEIVTVADFVDYIRSYNTK